MGGMHFSTDRLVILGLTIPILYYDYHICDRDSPNTIICTQFDTRIDSSTSINNAIFASNVQWYQSAVLAHFIHSFIPLHPPAPGLVAPSGAP